MLGSRVPIGQYPVLAHIGTADAGAPRDGSDDESDDGDGGDDCDERDEDVGLGSGYRSESCAST